MVRSTDEAKEQRHDLRVWWREGTSAIIRPWKGNVMKLTKDS